MSEFQNIFIFTVLNYSEVCKCLIFAWTLVIISICSWYIINILSMGNWYIYIWNDELLNFRSYLSLSFSHIPRSLPHLHNLCLCVLSPVFILFLKYMFFGFSLRETLWYLTFFSDVFHWTLWTQFAPPCSLNMQLKFWKAFWKIK